jgi:hypothetical protein
MASLCVQRPAGALSPVKFFSGRAALRWRGCCARAGALIRLKLTQPLCGDTAAP